jgi:virulence factor
MKKCLKNTPPQIIDIKRLSPLPARITDVSCVIDMMIHDVDLAIDLAGSSVKTLKASGKKVATNKLDQANAVIVFKNGVIANIEASRVNDEKVRKLIAAGKETYEADLLNKCLKRSGAGRSENIRVKTFDQLNAELRDFISSILSKKKPSITGEDGLNALEAANMIEEAGARS